MKKQSTMKGFAILSAASIIVKVLSLLYIPILLNIIGEEGNGIYAAAYQVYVFVYVLTNAGIPVAISKLVSELSALENYKDTLKAFKLARFMLIVTGFLMSLLLFLLAGPVSRLLHYEKSYLAILALSPTLLFTSISSSYRGYFQGRGNMTPTAVSQVIEQVVNTIFTLIFAWLLLRYGVEAACAGGTIGTSLGALFAASYLVHYYKKHKAYKFPRPVNTEKVIKRHSAKQLFKKILNYGIPITLCVGMQYAGNLVDVWNTKSRLLASGFSDVNATKLYSHLYKYQQLMGVPTSLISSLAVALLPAISGAVAINNKKEVHDKINFAFRLCFLIALPAAVGLSVLSSQIFKFLGYGAGWYLMRYGSFVLILAAIVQIQTTILQSLGKLYTITSYLIIGIAGKILSNYILIAIPQINIMGAIIGNAVGYSIPIILNNIVMQRTLKIKFNMLRHALKPALASALMGTVVYTTYYLLHGLLSFVIDGYIGNAIPVILSIFIGVYSYLLALIMIRGITKKDLKMMPAKVTKLIPKGMLKKIY